MIHEIEITALKLLTKKTSITSEQFELDFKELINKFEDNLLVILYKNYSWFTNQQVYKDGKVSSPFNRLLAIKQKIKTFVVDQGKQNSSMENKFLTLLDDYLTVVMYDIYPKKHEIDKFGNINEQYIPEEKLGAFNFAGRLTLFNDALQHSKAAAEAFSSELDSESAKAAAAKTKKRRKRKRKQKRNKKP